MAERRISRDMQVRHVWKLLEVRGEKAAEEVKRRIGRGEGITAKGLLFDADVLAEALAHWSRAQCRVPSKPAPQSGTTPSARVAATTAATPARVSTSGTTSPRKRAMSPVREEQADPGQLKVPRAKARRVSDPPSPAAKPQPHRPPERPAERIEIRRPVAAATPAATTSETAASEAARKEEVAANEVRRVLGLRKESFHTLAAWGFATLACHMHDVTSVQRAYRTLMKKLHPDKVGNSPDVARAVELLREGKEHCERKLSQQEPPGQPTNLRFKVLCDVKGRRRIKLEWSAPMHRELAPVKRYVVAVFDPSYGKALTVTILEPDYDEELRRYVSVEELGSYVLAEEDLQKMPSVFQQQHATVQVAAANKAGQSSWSTIRVPLTASAAAPAQMNGLLGPSAGRLGVSCGLQASNRDDLNDPREFEKQMRMHSVDLHSWLERQKRGPLAGWLKAAGLSSLGPKAELADRIYNHMAGLG